MNADILFSICVYLRYLRFVAMGGWSASPTLAWTFDCATCAVMLPDRE
ncbi:hypothetical protein ACFLQM_01600 [Acidobacteriota bacterium]